jgi:methylisocitrate lyase
MTRLEAEQRDPRPPGERLAALLARPGIVAVPGAHDALAGLLARDAGFEALYVSGAALSAGMGLPDIGLIGLDEVCFFSRAIYRATDSVLIVDADTGHGEAIGVMRCVRALEDAGAAAIQIEDQVTPKKCGHLDGKRLVAPAEMAAKVDAARRARRHARIIARTDAAAVEGLDGAMARARLYVEAGADIVFPEALEDEAAFRAFADALDVPLLANMTEDGRTPDFTQAQFEDFGYAMVIWPVSSLRAAAAAAADLYAGLARDGTTQAMRGRMQSRAALYETIGYDAVADLDGAIAEGAARRGGPNDDGKEEA